MTEELGEAAALWRFGIFLKNHGTWIHHKTECRQLNDRILSLNEKLTRKKMK